MKSLQRRLVLVDMSNNNRNIVIQCENCDCIVIWNNNRMYSNYNDRSENPRKLNQSKRVNNENQNRIEIEQQNQQTERKKSTTNK